MLGRGICSGGPAARTASTCSPRVSRDTVDRVQPLGFRFDVDAVIVDGVAHRSDCALVAPLRPAGAVWLAAGEVYRSQRCPRECACAPAFETLLSYQLEACSVS